MQEIRWKEPEIISEIEKQRALAERPQRLRLFLFHLLLRVGFMLSLPVVCYLLFSYFWGKTEMTWKILELPVLLIAMNTVPDVFHAWLGAPHEAAQCRVNRFGTTNIGTGENIAWRDIENYRFEACDDAPNLRVLVVEARGRKAPLRLYYEGEQLEERLRDAMAQGLASTRIIPQGTILT